MIASKHTFDKINHLIKLSIDHRTDPLTKALQIARETGAFKQSNVVFVYQQLYPINPHNPGQSIQHLKIIKQRRSL